MPFESILYVSFVVTALSLFASVLAYGDWATRNIGREPSVPQQNAKAEQLKREESAQLRRAA